MLIKRPPDIRLSEITEERYALKVLRGDFRDLPPVAEGDAPPHADRALQAVRH